jgi:hypothetical protein
MQYGTSGAVVAERSRQLERELAQAQGEMTAWAAEALNCKRELRSLIAVCESGALGDKEKAAVARAKECLREAEKPLDPARR